MQIQSIPYAPAADPSGYQYDSSRLYMQQAQAVSIETAQEKEIVFHTREGDTVTLSAAQQLKASYTSSEVAEFSQQSLIGSGEKATAVQSLTEKRQSFTFLDSREMAITVEGELSDEEIADIQKAVREIDRIMTPLLSGENPTATIEQVEKLMGLETIAWIEADYSASTTVAVAQSSLKEQLTYTRQGLMAQANSEPRRFERPPVRELSEVVSKALEKNRMARGKLRHPLRQLFRNMKRFHRASPDSLFRRQGSDGNRFFRHGSVQGNSDVA